MRSTEKTASVKLTLNGSSYIVAIKEAAKENERAAQRSGNAWKTAGVAGLKAMGRAASELGSTLKNTIRMVGGIGGALSLEEGVRGAINLRGEFKRLAFDVQAGSGEVVEWSSLLKAAQEQALKWGIATEELGHGFKIVRDQTGNFQFAEQSMGAIAVAARATKEPVESLATVAGKLNEKFGVSAQQLPEALAIAFSLSKQGGIQFDEMGAAIDRVGSSAKLMGIQGVGGFQRIMGMANLAKGDAKNVRGALMGVMGLLEDMGKPEFGKKIGSTFGVMAKDAKGHARDITEVLGAIFKRTGGKQELLAKGFEGEQLKIVTDLGQVFRTTFETTSGTVQQKTAAATKAFKDHLDDAGKTMIHASDLQAKAEKGMADPAAQMAVAMEKLKAAFTSPEMMNGLLRLAEVAPRAANGLAHLLEMVFEHPAMAAGIFAGIKLGVPLIQGAMQSGAAAFAQAAMKTIASGGGSGLGAAGSALAVGAAGVVGYGLGGEYAKSVVDPAATAAAQKSRTLSEALTAADVNMSGRTSKTALEQSLAEVRARREAAEKDREFQAADVYTFGIRRAFTAGDDDISKAKDYESKLMAAITKLADAVTDKAGDIKNVKIDGPGGGGAGGGGGAYRGPPRPAPAAPGYSR